MHRGECREFSKIFSGRKEELVGSFVKFDADAMGEQRGWGGECGGRGRWRGILKRA